jgi:multidrug efflux pump subunit AcrB
MVGVSPDTMATTVATPLERQQLGIIADVTEMTSQSTVGTLDYSPIRFKPEH